jgi:tetratricopeptide (TPR) repeat protein
MLHALQATSVYKAIRPLALILAVNLAGCAGSVVHWIVETRVHQGDVALAHGNVHDAALAYQLALRIDPQDVRARDGFVGAAALLAQAEYTGGEFEDALATIDSGLKYDPSSVHLQALKTQIESAKLKREIVISNYPTYKAAGTQISTSYAQLTVANSDIVKSLKRFSYTFDTDDLTDAIKRSYELELEIAHDTNRLIAYRQLVSAGVPATEEKPQTSAGAASLLPLP